MYRATLTCAAGGLLLVLAMNLLGPAPTPSRAGESAPDLRSLDWQLPRSRAMLPFTQQRPIQFVSMQNLAEWQELKGYWNPTTEEAADPVTGAKVKRPVVKIKVPLGLSGGPKVPAENELTVARWELGRDLYFDRILSTDSTISCASCHEPRFGFTDQMPVSTGVKGQKGGVNAPSVMNAAYNFFQFWDGRAGTLEDQAQGPVANPVEMFIERKGDHAWNSAVQRVRKKGDYTKRFLLAYGTEPTRDTIAKAIACYERTVLNGNSIHDRADLAMKIRVAEEGSTNVKLLPQDYEGVLKEAQAKKDTVALEALGLDAKTGAAKLKDVAAKLKQGRDLFFGKARCTLCHVGDNFTDGQFHNLGVGAKEGIIPAGHLGRYGALPLGHKDAAAVGAFKTPHLRGLLGTAPYMHDGSDDTLEKVIDFYDRGGNANEYLDPKMRDLEAERAYVLSKRGGPAYNGPKVTLCGPDQKPIVPFPLKLTAPEKTALVLFLRSLQGEVDPLVASPSARPPSAAAVKGRTQPAGE